MRNIEFLGFAALYIRDSISISSFAVSPPRAPDTVQVHVVSSTTVSISWLQPQSELPIVSYDIRYRVSPDQATSSHEDDFIHEFTEYVPVRSTRYKDKERGPVVFQFCVVCN